MDNETHIGFVYAHPKSDGSHNNIHFFHKKLILIVSRV
jgi:hypothetical protein